MKIRYELDKNELVRNVKEKKNINNRYPIII